MNELPELPAQPVTVPASPESTPGLLRRVFRNRFGHWRAGWRLAIYLVAFVGLGLSLHQLVEIYIPDLGRGDDTSFPSTMVWVVRNLAALLAAIAMLRVLDRRPLGLLGLGFAPGWLRELGIGLGGGVVLVTGLVAGLLVTSSVSLRLAPDLAERLATLPEYLLVFTLAAAFEELLFRGYPLQVLAEGSRRWIAAAVLCLLFTMAHFGNPDLSVVGAVNVLLLGILLAVAYFRTRRLWLPVGLHMAWNWSHGWLWGFDVSGMELDESLFTAALDGPELLTGGTFGLEGSVLTTVVVLAALWWLGRTRHVVPTAETTAGWARYPAGFGLAPQETDAPAVETVDEDTPGAQL